TVLPSDNARPRVIDRASANVPLSADVPPVETVLPSDNARPQVIDRASVNAPVSADVLPMAVRQRKLARSRDNDPAPDSRGRASANDLPAAHVRRWANALSQVSDRRSIRHARPRHVLR
ncbi:MAG: hypothetical protein EA381_17455, partial [Planctomycetaceae bacterium]